MKRFISTILIVIMLVSTLPVAAAEKTAIIGSAAVAKPGVQVTVTLHLNSNPGIASWTITLDWDTDALHLDEESAAIGSAFSGGMFASNVTAPGQLRMAWASMMDVTSDGELITLSFTIADDAEPGSYTVDITASGVRNQDGDPVATETFAAEITIPEKEVVIRPVTPVLPRPEKSEQEPEEQPEKETVEEPKEEAPVAISFTDVPETAYYYQAALWAADKDITNGTAPGLFSPEQVCDRGQAVTFLWRAAGSPEPKNDKNPFTDVSVDAYYYKAVLWAVERGITNGTSETMFSPTDTVTRAQIAAFLYRNEQANGGGFQGAWMFRIPFTDLPDWAFESIAWCYMKDITNGTSETTFSPDAPCTRGQIVAFLYRTFAEQEN